MCTAISYTTNGHYFGRTLDYEVSFGEQVVITPRNFPLPFRCVPALDTHYALIGMATIADGYPLYFEASNEKGLSMAGLNFPGNADYKIYAADRDNVTPFEFIPWVLGQCACLDEARTLLRRINLINIPFSPRLPLAPLHWLIADRNGAMTLEPTKEGLHIYDNPVGVLTNNPPFEFHLHNLSNYMGLTREPAENRFSNSVPLLPYSRGMGAMGLPGDLSSASRFVRAAFTKLNSISPDGETAAVNQFFHILGSVEQQRGCVHLGNGQYERTIYTSCCNTARGIYYYTTYENSRISCVDMHRENLKANTLFTYPLLTEADFYMQN